MSAKQLCKYFQSNACSKGSACEFSHDRGASKTDNVCKFYLVGNCSYGKGCRYDHVRPKKPEIKPMETKRPPVRAIPKPVPVSLLPEPAPPKKTFSGTLNVHSAPFVPAAARADVGDFAEYYDEVAGDLGPSPNNPFSYASLTKHNLPPAAESTQFTLGETGEELETLCPYGLAADMCPLPDCKYLHGDLCPCCMRLCLHPHSQAERDQHTERCLAEVEEGVKESEKIKRSEDMECSICMEVVLSKTSFSERRFGILESCTHCFCLSCLRNWRATAGQADTTRSCPLCRAHSHFITPSSFWVSDPEEKRALVEDYQANMKTIDCRQFNFGEGACPFGTSCFYRHATRDGSEVVSTKARYRYNADSAEGAAERIQEVRLWDFLAQRDNTM